MAKHDRYLNSILVLEQAGLCLAVILIVLLLLAQTAVVYLPAAGPYMNIALRLEGQSLGESDALYPAADLTAEPWAVINLKLVDYVSRSDVTVFADGEELGSFISGQAAVPVKQGTVITVKNADPKLPVTIVINSTTPNILEPAPGDKIRGSGDLRLGPVVLKP